MTTLDLRTGRQASLLYALLAISAPIGLMVVPAQLYDAADAALTASRIADRSWLLRLGVASELFHQAVQAYLMLVLYDFFKPVSAPLARQMTVLGLVSIPITFLNVLNEVAALTLVSGADFLAAFSKPQLDAAALLCMRLHADGLQVAAVFWGLWLFPLAMLLWRLGRARKLVAALVATAGVGYVVGATAALALPQFEPQLRGWVQLMVMGEMAVIVWFVAFSLRRQSGL
ncbi:DUF4386 domain-containing protein [Roseateles paludis]|uniref:DUF4386 domain-containing protein n=1 Tax=Roseateles paludis TaxID=3145238 RepID=A0ABV0FXU7_9BURK